ncbi:MAG: glycoside hydrolase family 2 TIM barrel-domain containing protein [Candidatus Moraniibacteriota bacterium]
MPRWPECHIPAWAAGDTAMRQGALLDFMDETVRRYRDNGAVAFWQVENEPFLSQFGECPPLDVNFLESEISLVKALDPTRPVIVTDSGELSLWFPGGLHAGTCSARRFIAIFTRTAWAT